MRNPRAGIRDMILSLLVILVPAAGLYWLFGYEPDEPSVAAVDHAPIVADARAQAGYPVLAPTSLGDGWKVTKARWAAKGENLPGSGAASGNTWQFGALGPDKVYYELRQRDADVAALVSDATRTGYPDGSSTVSGKAYVRMTSADGRTHCLVDQTKSVGTTICADTDFAHVEEFAKQLSAK